MVYLVKTVAIGTGLLVPVCNEVISCQDIFETIYFDFRGQKLKLMFFFSFLPSDTSQIAFINNVI
jgi:hypothetical protein